MSTAAVGVRPIRTLVVVLPEIPRGLRHEALENQILVACQRSGMMVLGVHWCGKGSPTLLQSKIRQADTVLIFSRHKICSSRSRQLFCADCSASHQACAEEGLPTVRQAMARIVAIHPGSPCPDFFASAD